MKYRRRLYSSSNRISKCVCVCVCVCGVCACVCEHSNSNSTRRRHHRFPSEGITSLKHTTVFFRTLNSESFLYSLTRHTYKVVLPAHRSQSSSPPFLSSGTFITPTPHHHHRYHHRRHCYHPPPPPPLPLIFISIRWALVQLFHRCIPFQFKHSSDP